jgi:glycerol-3-phosphate dehydrogenase
VPVLSLIGGKWTTFRALAAEVTDDVLALLRRSRRIDTTLIPIGGGREFPLTDDTRAAWIARVAQAYALTGAYVEACLDRYGTRAEALLQPLDGTSADALAALPEYGQSELRNVIAREQVVNLTDIVLRRLPITVSGRLTSRAAAEIAAHAASVLQWSDDERERQLDDLRTVMRERHGIDLDAVASSRTPLGAPR